MESYPPSFQADRNSFFPTPSISSPEQAYIHQLLPICDQMSATLLSDHLDSVLKSGREAQARRQCSSISELIVPDEVPSFTSDPKRKRSDLWHKRESHDSGSESGDDCDRPLVPKLSRRPSTILHAFERFRRNRPQDQDSSNRCKNEARDSGTQTDLNTRLSPMRRDSFRQKLHALFADNIRTVQSRKPHPRAMVRTGEPVSLVHPRRSDPAQSKDPDSTCMPEALNPIEHDSNSTGDWGFKTFRLGSRTRSISSSSWRSDNSRCELDYQPSATAETDVRSGESVDSQRWRTLNGYSPPPTPKPDRTSQMPSEKLVNFRDFLRQRHVKSRKRMRPISRNIELTMGGGALQHKYPHIKYNSREPRMESLYQLGVLPPIPSETSPEKSPWISHTGSKTTDAWTELHDMGPSHSPSRSQSCNRARSPSSSQAADIDSNSEHESIVEVQRIERLRVAFAALSAHPISPTSSAIVAEQADPASRSKGVSVNHLSYTENTADDASTRPRLSLKRSAACMAESTVISDEEPLQHPDRLGNHAQQETQRVVPEESDDDESFSECVQHLDNDGTAAVGEQVQQESTTSSYNTPATQQVGLDGLEGLEGYEFVQRILAWTARREDAARGAGETEEWERGRPISRR